MAARLFARVAACAVAYCLSTGTAVAGAIFITGHDPDFHAQGSAEPGAQNLLRIGLNYARNGDGTVTSNPAALPILWIESDPAEDGGIPGGHRFGLDGLRNIGYRAVGELGAAPEGRYVFADADMLTNAFWATVTTASYSAIGVASTFGGILRQAELDNLNGHTAEIAAFFNAGGGIFAAAEGSEGANLAPAGGYFNWIPIAAASATSAAPPYSVTAFGATLGLTNGDVSSPSHSHFESDGGLDVVSRDNLGRIMTLADVTTITDGGFGAPEPGSLALVSLALLIAGGRGLFSRRPR
jgi:hypothetical protein